MALYDHPSCREHFEQSFEFAQRQWEREEQTFGPAKRVALALATPPTKKPDFDSLPVNPTIKDLAKLWDTTIGAIHKRIARGKMIPKPIRRKKGEVYRWRKEDIIILFGPKVRA